MQGLLEAIQQLDHESDYERSIQKLEVSSRLVYTHRTHSFSSLPSFPNFFTSCLFEFDRSLQNVALFLRLELTW